MLKYSMNQASSLNWSFERDLRAYAELGVPAIGVQLAKLEKYGVGAGVRLLEESGLPVATVVSIGFFTLDDASCWSAEIERVKQQLALSAEIGSEGAVLLSGSAGALSYEEAEANFVDILEELLPAAEALRLPFFFEHNSGLRVDLGYVHSLHDALDLADRVDSPWFKVCAELNNAWIERHLYPNIRERTHRIGLVQVNDFAAGTLATPARVPPGDGIIPLARILTAFVEAGYPGYYDIELIGPDIEAMGYERALQRSLAWVRRFAPGA